MSKKIVLSIGIVFIIMASPVFATSTALPLNISKNSIKTNSDEVLFPFWYLCHVNTSGYGRAIHSGNSIFIAIEYDPEDVNVSTTIKSFFNEVTINETHNIQVFFFIGDSNIPLSGLKGDISLNGMALIANIW